MDKIEYIVGNELILQKIHTIKAWKPFDDNIISFCDKLSKVLLKTKGIQQFSDLVSLAFWLRKSNLQSISKNYLDLNQNLGIGLVFHIAPGNMGLSFAYSLITGLLTGNTNIIRLPSRRFEQADIFCDVLRKQLIENNQIAERICLIKYPHNKEITDILSMQCNVRIIWGGDNTVNTIRESSIRPRASEITFANRYSVCIINSDSYLNYYNEKKTAHDFYIDTYLTDQNACSSPRIIFWMGNCIDEAKEVFWNALKAEIKSYNIASVTTSDKLITFCKFASESKCHMKTVGDFKIMRIEIPSVNENVFKNIGNSGYFYECNINHFEELLPICKWELQTISYIGIDVEKLHSVIIEAGVKGVDRIVPVGKTMDFDFNWDGKDIIREMTRIISLK